MTQQQIDRVERRMKGFERRTVYANNQIRFFVWLNKFYYRPKNKPKHHDTATKY